jgi:VWFA-related protein
MRTPSLLLCLVFSALRQGEAQPPPEGAPDAVFRATTKLVQVSVIARDQSGKPVADLRREEFQIFDNGSPQEIRVFVAEKNTPETAPAAPPKGTFSNQVAGPAATRSGYSVILIDNLLATSLDPDPNTDEEGAGLARLKTLKLLRSLPLGEKIAIYATGRALKVICEFTSDRDLLEQELGKWKPSVDNPDTVAQPIKETIEVVRRALLPGMNLESLQRQLEESSRIDMAERMDPSDSEMEAVADHLAGIPGRKNLLWLSNRFAIGRRAIQKFSRASVSLYPMDMDGVCPKCSPRPIAAMNAIAAATGGLAFYQRNDIDVAMREAIEDGMASYLLGFYQPKEEQTAVHQLSIRVSRAGVTLRYRGSYQSEPRTAVAADTVAEMIEAMNRPVDATAIAITASATRKQDHLDLSATLDVSSLDLQLEQGLWKGQAELVARFMTAEGTQAGGVVSQTITFNLLPKTYASALEAGLPYRKELTIPPKAVELKLLLGSLPTGKIGTLTIPLSKVEPTK